MTKIALKTWLVSWSVETEHIFVFALQDDTSSHTVLAHCPNHASFSKKEILSLIISLGKYFEPNDIFIINENIFDGFNMLIEHLKSKI